MTYRFIFSTYKKGYNRHILTTRYLILVAILYSITSCKKFIDVAPPITSTNANNVYSNDQTASAVLTGIYTNISNSSFSNGGILSISLFPSLSGDELELFSGVQNIDYKRYYTNSLTSTISDGYNLWTNIYPTIFFANSAIEGLNKSDNLTTTIKNQLIGEALFIRAFCYFYLVNLYGDVPLALSTNYKKNVLLPRTNKQEVWNQIILDLQSSQSLLSDNYLNASVSDKTEERVRPNKSVAAALLARVYLYTEDYSNAEKQSSFIIDNKSVYKLSNLNEVFFKNSSEAIWQLQPVIGNINTQEALMFVIPSTGLNDSYPVYLSSRMIQAFESHDLRMINWIDSTKLDNKVYYYSFKYKNSTLGSGVTEYEMVLRLAEQYLIRSEARANLNNFNGACDDLNAIRARSGLKSIFIESKTDLINTILHERQVELFTEWGQRWFDLKRLNKVDEIMSIVTQMKGGHWNSNYQLYPIPFSQLSISPNIKQNQGY